VARVPASLSRHPGHIRAALVLPGIDDWTPATSTILDERSQRHGTRQRPAEDFTEYMERDQRLISQYTTYQ